MSVKQLYKIKGLKIVPDSQGTVGKNVFDILLSIDMSFYSSIDLSMNPFVDFIRLFLYM